MSDSFIWPIDRTLSNATTQGQSRAESNGNEWVLHIPQSSKAGTSPSVDLVSNSGHLFEWGGGLLHCRDVVSVSHSPRQQGWEKKFININKYNPH